MLRLWRGRESERVRDTHIHNTGRGREIWREFSFEFSNKFRDQV